MSFKFHTREVRFPSDETTSNVKRASSYIAKLATTMNHLVVYLYETVRILQTQLAVKSEHMFSLIDSYTFTQILCLGPAR